jgi:uncharacterized protein
VVRDRGPWLTLSGGRRFYFLDPQPGDLALEDVALGLARERRFSNQCPIPVGQHSWNVAEAVFRLGGSPDEQLAGLMHDSGESILHDIATPVKVLIPRYAAIEQGILWSVFEACGLPPEIPQIVHDADRMVLTLEAEHWMGPLEPDHFRPDAHDWFRPADVHPKVREFTETEDAWPEFKAYAWFVSAFSMLSRGKTIHPRFA